MSAAASYAFGPGTTALHPLLVPSSGGAFMSPMPAAAPLVDAVASCGGAAAAPRGEFAAAPRRASAAEIHARHAKHEERGGVAEAIAASLLTAEEAAIAASRLTALLDRHEKHEERGGEAEAIVASLATAAQEAANRI